MSAVMSSSRPLVERFWPQTQDHKTVFLRGLLLVLLGAGLLALSAKFKVPFWPVPMTLQSLVVLLLGATLGSRLGPLAVLAYIAQGTAGLPVFANTPPQVASVFYLLGPTGGYLAGFVLAAFVAGLAVEKGLASRPWLFAFALIVADSILMLCGWLWLGLFAQMASGATGIGLAKAYESGIAPFHIAGALKVAIVAVAIPIFYRRSSHDS
jgi:biotin transport system substrate-specific component